MFMIIGIDIGGTKCAVIQGDKTGKILDKIVFKTTNFQDTYSKIFQTLQSLPPFESVGISCGGPLDEEQGVILSPPNLPDWDKVHIIDDVTKKFNVPCKMRNDANACALAEHKFGAGVGYKNCIFLTFGTGMGAGFILDGKLYSGTNGNAGEIGHIRMAKNGPLGFHKFGSFEGFCSGQGLKQLGEIYLKKAQQKGITPSYAHIKDFTAKELADCARAGDTTAKKVFEKCGVMLGKGLSILVDVLNPQRIILGSVYVRCIDLLEKPMMKVLKKECLSVSLQCCQVVPACLGESIGDMASLAVAIEALS